mgnify:CR=1 FL=1
MEPDDSDVTYRKEQTGDTTTIVPDKLKAFVDNLPSAAL